MNSVEGLESRCRIIVRDEKETWKDYAVFNTVTWIGEGGPRDPPPGWIALPSITRIDQAVPEISIEWFHENHSSIDSIVSISSFDWGSHSLSDSILTLVEPLNGLRELTEALGSEGGDLSSLEAIKDGLWSEIKTIEGSVNDAIVASTSDANLSLDGEEVLSFYADADGLNRRIQAAVATGIEQAVQDGRNKLDIISMMYPSESLMIGLIQIIRLLFVDGLWKISNPLWMLQLLLRKERILFGIHEKLPGFSKIVVSQFSV